MLLVRFRLIVLREVLARAQDAANRFVLEPWDFDPEVLRVAVDYRGLADCVVVERSQVVAGTRGWFIIV